jgi:uncharacterized protein
MRRRESELRRNLYQMSKQRIRTLALVMALLVAVSQLPGLDHLHIALAQSGQTVALQSPPPDPYAGLSIAELTIRTYGGGLLSVDQTLQTTPGFTRYLIHYPSDGLTIYGFMDIPASAPHSASGYPVIIAIHGYIDPGLYQTLDYTTAYADALAQAGYIVLHPNLRNYRPSDTGPNLFRVGFAVDVLNLAAIVRAQAGKFGPLQLADSTEIGLWGHSMGGGISIRAMTIDPQIKAVLLYAPISGNDLLDAQRYLNRPGQYEANVPDAVYQRVSPIYFYDHVQAAVSIHQGLADQTVPPEWSADLCARLQALHKVVECFTYPGQPHTFTATGNALLIPRMIAFFDAYLKNS